MRQAKFHEEFQAGAALLTSKLRELDAEKTKFSKEREQLNQD